jgi:hypothetical protein
MTLRRSWGQAVMPVPKALADPRRLVVWADRGGLAGPPWREERE